MKTRRSPGTGTCCCRRGRYRCISLYKGGRTHCGDGNVALQLQENGSDDSREENASQNPGAAGRNFNNVISLHEKLTVSERPASQSKKQEATLEAPENSLEIETREEQQGEYESRKQKHILLPG